MQAQAEIGAADDPRVVFGLEEPRAQLNPPRRQPGEPPLELGAARAVARHQNHQLGESPAAVAGLPAANALLEVHDRLDDDVEVLVFGPARRADDEADGAGADAEPGEQRLAEPLAVGTLDRHERRGRPIVEHLRVLHAETGSRETRRGRATPRGSRRPAAHRGARTSARAAPPDAIGPGAAAAACSRGCASR